MKLNYKTFNIIYIKFYLFKNNEALKYSLNFYITYIYIYYIKYNLIKILLISKYFYFCHKNVCIESH